MNFAQMIQKQQGKIHSEISGIPATSGEIFQHRDPAKWLKVTDKTRCFLIRYGPEQERREFFQAMGDFDNRM